MTDTVSGDNNGGVSVLTIFPTRVQVPPEDGVVLHYESAHILDWFHKFITYSSDDLDLIPFGYYKESIDAVQVSREYFLKKKRKHMMFPLEFAPFFSAGLLPQNFPTRVEWEVDGVSCTRMCSCALISLLLRKISHLSTHSRSFAFLRHVRVETIQVPEK